MPFKDDGTWQVEDDNVQNAVKGVIDQGGPLMQQAKTQAKQAANRRGLLNSSMAVQAGQEATYKAALPIASQQSQQTHAKNLAQMDIDSSRSLHANDTASKERIAAMNIAAHDREKATSALAAMESVYSEQFKAIAGNHEIPVNARNAYNTHIAALRDSNLALVEQMYGIDLDWGTTGQAQV